MPEAGPVAARRLVPLARQYRPDNRPDMEFAVPTRRFVALAWADIPDVKCGISPLEIEEQKYSFILGTMTAAVVALGASTAVFAVPAVGPHGHGGTSRNVVNVQRSDYNWNHHQYQHRLDQHHHHWHYYN
jgi:hypothetical protein